MFLTEKIIVLIVNCLSYCLDRPQPQSLSWSSTASVIVLIVHSLSHCLDHPLLQSLSWSSTASVIVLIIHCLSHHLDHLLSWSRTKAVDDQDNDWYIVLIITVLGWTCFTKILLFDIDNFSGWTRQLDPVIYLYMFTIYNTNILARKQPYVPNSWRVSVYSKV